MDRNKRNLALAAAGGVALIAAALQLNGEPEKAKPRAKTDEEARLEQLADLIPANSVADSSEVSAGGMPPPPAAVPMPDGEAFDITGAVSRHNRSAGAADASDYLDCDGDCTGLGAQPEPVEGEPAATAVLPMPMVTDTVPPDAQPGH
ncbi:MAG TPA: hypothetical protein VGW34_00745 [Allosphingosinicella sp.]|nr:hypothetical protein [Allosphingosinicella sp.]